MDPHAPSQPTAGSLAAQVAQDGPLSFTDVLALGADVSGELAAAAESGQPSGAVAADTIVARPDGPWALVPATDAGGAPAAVAPELEGGGGPTAAGDVYALGATLVFALTGMQFDEAGFGGADAQPDAVDTPADGATPEAEATDAADAVRAPGDAAGEPSAGADVEAPTEAIAAVPQSLPDVMAAFLDTLRAMLATDPAHRVAIGVLAGTLRQLRDDAARVMGPPVVPIGDGDGGSLAGAAAAGAVGGAAAGALLADDAFADGLSSIDGLDGVQPVTGTDAAASPSAARQRAPYLVAAAMAVVVLILAVALVRKGDSSGQVAAGPGTTVATSTTTTAVPVISAAPDTEAPTTTTTIATTTTTRPTTTVPVVVPPPPTAPPTTAPPEGTVLVVVDMSGMTTCPGCLASLRSQPALVAGLTAQFPDKTNLWGQCFTTGDTTHDDLGFTSSNWIYIVGPLAQGWLPEHLAGRQTYGLPPCPQAPATTTSTAPTTTRPSTTTTTTPVTP